MYEQRTHSFRRNILLEELLVEINSNLQPSEKNILKDYFGVKEMTHPLIMVMGPLRSGTTLFMQWLANTGLVAYPTNLLSRFYQAPIIGAKIQQMLTDPQYNFRDELGEFLQQVEYYSENGKTKGVLSPNEFWYFWRRFLSDPKRDLWTNSELHDTMDIETMQAELAGIMSVFNKPFAAKGMLFNYNIGFLNSIFDKILFVQIRRDPITNISSVLEARESQLGSKELWYSFKIPEFQQLQGLDPITQAAWQVQCINNVITREIEKVHETRRFIVQYEEFCAAPAKVFKEFSYKIYSPNAKYNGPESFKITRNANVQYKSDILKALNNLRG